MKPVPESGAMNFLRASGLALLPIWVAACATAENTGPGLDQAAGATQTPAGAAGTVSPAAGAGAAAGADASSGGASSANAGSNAGGQSNGQAGAGGSSGSSGASGSAGSSAGAPPAFDPGACAAAPTFSLKYKGSPDAQKIAAQYQFVNTSDTPVAIASLSIRYFFSNEETSAWKPTVYNAQIDGGVGYRAITEATLKVVPLGSKADGADTYAELTFAAAKPAGITLEKGATASVSWDLQPTNYEPPAQVQSDDYSYNAAATAFTVWDHVVIYQNDTLVWGCLPKSGSGGAGSPGSGGAGGSGGSGGAAGSGGAGGATASGGALAGGAGTGGSRGGSAGSGGAR
jgi:hypothetical protein